MLKRGQFPLSVVGLDLEVAPDGRVDLAEPMTPANASESQAAFLEALNSPGQVVLNCDSGARSDVHFGQSDHAGTHTVDLADLDKLGAAGNDTSFTGGAVVVHEVLEGHAEVALGMGGVGSFAQAHAYAGRFAPGITVTGVNDLSGNPAAVTTAEYGANVMRGRNVVGNIGIQLALNEAASLAQLQKRVGSPYSTLSKLPAGTIIEVYKVGR